MGCREVGVQGVVVQGFSLSCAGGLLKPYHRAGGNPGAVSAPESFAVPVWRRLALGSSRRDPCLCHANSAPLHLHPPGCHAPCARCCLQR